MKAVIQRVSRAEVRVDQEIKGKINTGILVLLGIEKGDQEKDLKWIIDKIANLRIFPDDGGRFDKSLIDISGSLLIISQFTLLGDCRKGRRPGFDKAEEPEKAQLIYNQAVTYAKSLAIHTEKGVFGAHMEIDFINDGPVTFIIESPNA